MDRKSKFSRQQTEPECPSVLAAGLLPGAIGDERVQRHQMSGECPTGQGSLSPPCPLRVSCLSPACPCVLLTPSPEGTPRRDPNMGGKGFQPCRAECLEVWRCLCNLSSSTPDIFLSWRAAWLMLSEQAAVSTFASCCPCSLLVPFPCFHGGTLNPALETKLWFHGPSSHSCGVQAPQNGISFAESWILGTPIKHRLLTLFNKLVEIAISTHFVHSLWASGSDFSSSVCGQKLSSKDGSHSPHLQVLVFITTGNLDPEPQASQQT